MNKIENIILVSCSIKPAVAGIVIFFKPLKYPFKVSLIPARGIKIIVDRNTQVLPVLGEGESLANGNGYSLLGEDDFISIVNRN